MMADDHRARGIVSKSVPPVLAPTSLPRGRTDGAKKARRSRCRGTQIERSASNKQRAATQGGGLTRQTPVRQHADALAARHNLRLSAGIRLGRVRSESEQGPQEALAVVPNLRRAELCCHTRRKPHAAGVKLSDQVGSFDSLIGAHLYHCLV